MTKSSYRRVVVVVNGRPRAGKDTAVISMCGMLAAAGWSAGAYSSIDPVRSLLLHQGIMHPDKKTGAERDLLASVGDALQRYNQFRTAGCLKRIEATETTQQDSCLFIHMREPANIALLREQSLDRVTRFDTLFVSGPRAEMVESNAADAGVEGLVYDHELVNDGSYGRLFSQCAGYVDNLLRTV